MPNVHIIPNGEQWNVQEENGSGDLDPYRPRPRPRRPPSLAPSDGGGEVFTHRDEGEFSRIRKGDAV